MKIKIIKESNDIKAALDAIPRMKPGQLTRYGPPEKRETRYDPETGKSITELPPGYTQVDPTEFPEEFRKIEDVVRSNTGTVDRHISHAIQANDMVKELAYQTYEDGFSSILSLAERRLSTKAALRSKELHDIQTGLSEKHEEFRKIQAGLQKIQADLENYIENIKYAFSKRPPGDLTKQAPTSGD